MNEKIIDAREKSERLRGWLWVIAVSLILGEGMALFGIAAIQGAEMEKAVSTIIQEKTKAATYRGMLLENHINPDTGRISAGRG